METRREIKPTQFYVPNTKTEIAISSTLKELIECGALLFRAADGLLGDGLAVGVDGGHLLGLLGRRSDAVGIIHPPPCRKPVCMPELRYARVNRAARH